MENNQKKEVNEALHAIEETLGHLSRAQDYLSSAGNWGLFDMIGGGFITTMIKHGKMNEAERAMAAARNSIRNLKKELSDVDQLVDYLDRIYEIAEKAGVNSALINYYFKSKDNLLIEAVNICMGNLFENIIQKTSKEIDPLLRLESMIKEIVCLGYNHYPLAKITVANELNGGGIITNKMIQPVLKEIFKQSKDEYEIKILAAQILLPVQVIFLNASAYQKYLQ